MGNPFKQHTVERTLILSFFLVSTLVTVLSLGISLTYEIYSQQKEMDAVISDAASSIAQLPAVVEMLEQGYPDGTVSSLLDTLCDTVQNIDVAVVYNNSGLRFYHTDRQTSGDSYVEGEETEILSGGDPYITSGYGSYGLQRRAYHGVESSSGELIGFVMISVFYENITESMLAIALFHGFVLLLMLAVSALVTTVVMRLLRQSLMGLRPEELVRRYLRQDEVLSAVEEGFVASDSAGHILFCNPALQTLLGQDEDLVGRPIQDIFPQTSAATIRISNQPIHRQTWVVGHNTVMANEIPFRIGTHGDEVGVLTVLFDQTELLRMSDQLFGAQNMLDTLRSFNHEFSNRLHVILGYLETEQLSEAKRMIVSSDIISSQHICQTADSIRVSQLSALVLGKMLRGAELGILISVTPDSYCMESDLLLPVDDCITLMGNLLQNAIEALSDSAHTPREIELGLYCRSDCNIFICQDSGCGMTAKVAEEMFQQGYSTKGSGRGTGMALIQRILTAHGGIIQVESEVGEGTCITVTFTREA